MKKMKTEIKNKIDKVTTLGQFLEVIKSEYKCTECKPGKLAKDILIRTILKQVNSNAFVNENIRLKAMQSENIEQLIETIKGNFTTELQFSGTAQKNLAGNLESLCKLISLKEK